MPRYVHHLIDCVLRASVRPDKHNVLEVSCIFCLCLAGPENIYVYINLCRRRPASCGVFACRICNGCRRKVATSIFSRKKMEHLSSIPSLCNRRQSANFSTSRSQRCNPVLQSWALKQRHVVNSCNNFDSILFDKRQSMLTLIGYGKRKVLRNLEHTCRQSWQHLEKLGTLTLIRRPK